MAGKGLIVVISAPSGGGKSTVIREIMKSGDGRYAYSISTTTRAKRENEVDGRDYVFVSEDAFNKSIETGEFLEWAIVHGNYYGTSKKLVDAMLEDDKIILLDIDVQGGLEVKSHYREKALLIFVMPPSLEELEARLRNRKTDDEREIAKRLAAVPTEIECSSYYDHIVVNKVLSSTVDEVAGLIDKRYDAMMNLEDE